MLLKTGSCNHALYLRWVMAGALCISASGLGLSQSELRDVQSQASLAGENEKSHKRLAPVIVTATKRSQDLTETSAAISVISSESILNGGMTDLADIRAITPGLTIGDEFAFAKIYLRGLGLNSSLPGLDPSVALHVDGAVISQPSQQFASLYDLERVEVLRGPQGTLYGRNAVGGSVNLITAKPTDQYEGYANISLGGPDLSFLVDGAISGPITQAVQARLAVRHKQREGYGTLTRTGDDIDNSNNLALRGQLNFDLTPNLSNLVMLEYYSEDSRAKAFKYFGPSFPETSITALQSDTGLDPLLRAQIPNLVTLAGPDALVDTRDAGGDVNPVGQLEAHALTNTLQWQINDALSLTAISNVRAGKSTLVQDFDVSNLVNGMAVLGDTINGPLLSDADQMIPTPSTVQAQIVESDQTSHEIQILWVKPHWDALFGAYHFRESVAATVPIGRDPLNAFNSVNVRAIDDDALSSLLPDARVVIPGDMDIEAGAVFANFRYHLSPQLRMKLGARYSRENRDIVVSTRLPGPAITLGPNSDSRNYTAFTPEIGMEYDWRHALVYATYSEGFKSGTSSLFDGTPELIDPETIRNFEFGIKGRYWDKRLALALAGFIYRVEDAQFDRTRLTAGGARFTTSVENAANTRGKGLELEAKWQATSKLAFDFYATAYDIRFGAFSTTNPIDPIGALQGLAGLPIDLADLSGNRPRNTPDFSFGLRTNYSHNFGVGGLLDWSAAYGYKSKQYFTEFNDARLSAPSYGVFDANLRYTPKNETFFINVWGRNLTDEFVPASAFAISTSRTITGTYHPPRSFGVTMGVQF